MLQGMSSTPRLPQLLKSATTAGCKCIWSNASDSDAADAAVSDSVELVSILKLLIVRLFFKASEGSAPEELNFLFTQNKTHNHTAQNW